MRKLLPAIIVGLLLLPIIGTTPAMAGTQGTCQVGDNKKVLFYENTIGDTSDGNDTLWQCAGGQADMRNVIHTLSGNCKSGVLKLNDNWDDCISSMLPYIPSGVYLCLYMNWSYNKANGYYTYDHADSVKRVNIPINDGLSSWKFVTLPSVC
jgi:hypothetical protein